MKKTLLGGLLIVGVAGMMAVYYYWRVSREPKRVWVEFSEKYQDRDPRRTQDYERVDKDSRLFAEERLARQISERPGCMVLTRHKNKADYVVTISVIRYLGGGETYGEASLTITERGGDVVLVDRFYQTRSSNEDIAEMPITEAWQAICAGHSK